MAAVYVYQRRCETGEVTSFFNTGIEPIYSLLLYLYKKIQIGRNTMTMISTALVLFSFYKFRYAVTLLSS